MIPRAGAGRPTSRAVCVAILGIATCGNTDVYAAPQTFNTALPVAKGEFIFREQLFYRNAGKDEGPDDRDLQVFGAVSVLGYGANSDLAVFGVLPYLDKRLRLDRGPGQRVARHTRGIGDARLFGRYTVFRRDRRGSNFRVAPFVGIEAPTGDNNDRDRLGRLPAPLQLGSGSWDPFGGLIATYQSLEFQIDAQVSYKVNTGADGFRFGNEFRFDASLQYRLWPPDLGTGVPGFLYGVVETNVRHRARNRIDGVADVNSGGTSVFISPGLQYVTKRWILEFIAQLPAIQHSNGTAIEDDFTLRAGFRVNF